MKKVLLDSSVIIAGLHSSKGASQQILQKSQNKEITAFVSAIIIQEVLRNLKKKFGEEYLQKFLEFLPKSNFKQVEFDRESEILNFANLTEEKDVHVLAAAFKAKVDYLVTLDKKHLLSKKIKGLKIITPGGLLQKLASG